MKIHELLLESDPFTNMKELNAEFKQLAADTDLTIVAGMGWPQVVKGGAWYGGGIETRGRKNKVQDALTLPHHIRVKGFLQLVAKKLEALIADGRTVKVAPGAARGTKTIDVKAGEVAKVLQDSAIMAFPPGNNPKAPEMPCVAWYVSTPPEFDNLTAVRVTYYQYISGPDSTDYAGRIKAGTVAIGSAFPPAQAKALLKKVNEIMTVSKTGVVKNAETDKYDLVPPTGNSLRLRKELMAAAEKLASAVDRKSPGKVDVVASHVEIKIAILTKTTIRVDPALMQEFYDDVMAIA